MKIASQLLNTAPNVAIKTASSSDSGVDFHSALTAAGAAKGADSDLTRAKTKETTPDAKSQPQDSKKKTAAPDLSASDLNVPVAPAPKQLPTDTLTQFAVALPQNNEAAALSSGHTLSDAQLSTDLAGIAGSLTSALASITSVVPLPANAISAGGVDHKILDAKPNSAATSSEDSGPSVDGAHGQLSNLNSPHPDLAAAPVGQTISTIPIAVATAAPLVQPPASGDSKAAAAEQNTDAPKRGDTSSSSATANTIDPAAIALQQAAAAAVQSVAAPVSLPGLSSASGPQPIPAVPTNNSISGNKVADTLKGAASRQNVTAAKAKPAASEASGKSTDGTDGETQTTTAPASNASFAAKVVEASGTPGQSANEPKGGFDAATLQLISPSGVPNGSSHMTQSAQSGSTSAESAAQTLPAQAPQESQAMQGVSSAQLIQSMRSSEMKLGMQSAEFGNISISTSLNHQALSAQISFDHLELGKALAVHLPAIEEKLGSAYGVQAKVELRDSNNPSPSNDSGYSSSGQQSREQRHSQGSGTAGTQGLMFERSAARTSFTTISPTASASRLDIRI